MRHTRAKCTHGHHNRESISNKVLDLPIAKKLEAPRALARGTHFQPAVLNRREYILPMSPMPIMPMLLRSSMLLNVLHANLRRCGEEVQPMLLQ